MMPCRIEENSQCRISRGHFLFVFWRCISGFIVYIYYIIYIYILYYVCIYMYIYIIMYIYSSGSTIAQVSWFSHGFVYCFALKMPLLKESIYLLLQWVHLENAGKTVGKHGKTHGIIHRYPHPTWRACWEQPQEAGIQMACHEMPQISTIWKTIGITYISTWQLNKWVALTGKIFTIFHKTNHLPEKKCIFWNHLPRWNYH